VLQHLEQFLRIMFDRLHANALEHGGKGPLHRPAVFQNVTDAAGTAAVVLQHQVLALVVADQIRAADVNVNVLRHVEVHELAPEMFSREDIGRRDDAVLQDFLLVINVAQEQVQRRDALREAAFELLPFLGRNDARQQVERENLLRARRIAIDVERDALAQKREVNRLAFVFEFPRRQGLEQLPELPVMRTQLALGIEHFVEKSVVLVLSEQALDRLRFGLGGHFKTPVARIGKWNKSHHAGVSRFRKTPNYSIIGWILRRPDQWPSPNPTAQVCLENMTSRYLAITLPNSDRNAGGRAKRFLSEHGNRRTKKQKNQVSSPCQSPNQQCLARFFDRSGLPVHRPKHTSLVGLAPGHSDCNR
jgi:hypothetical protein